MAETATVLELPQKKRKSPTRQAPAIGLSYVANLRGDAQVTAQCFVAQEDGEQAANDLLDRMSRLIGRQRAMCEREHLRAEVRKAELALTRHDEDVPGVEDRLDKERAKMVVEMNSYLEAADDAEKEGYETHTKTGRRGQYEATGSIKSRIERAKDAAAKVKEKIDGHDEQRRIGQADDVKLRSRFVQNIEIAKDDLRRCEETINGPANDVGTALGPDGA